MNIPTCARAAFCFRERLTWFVPVTVCVIIVISSANGFAQGPVTQTVPQAGDNATRPRRISSQDLDDVVSIDRNEKPSITPRRVFVRSTSVLVRAAVLEDKLLKQSAFQRLGFVVTRDSSEADLILELRHDLFTKYVFSVIDARTGLVLASGKLSSLGGTVAGKVAKRFVKEMERSAGP